MQDLFKTKKFQLETESSWKHLWSKPVFDYLHSDHFDGERFKRCVCLYGRPHARGNNSLRN